MFQLPNDKFDHHRFDLSFLYAAQPRKRLKNSYKSFKLKSKLEQEKHQDIFDLVT